MGLAFAVSVTCQAQTLNPPSPGGWNAQGHPSDYADHSKQENDAHQYASVHNPPVKKRIPGKKTQTSGHNPTAYEKQKALEDRWTLIFVGITAVSTFLLFIATSGLWFFTARMWKETRRVAIDGEKAIAAATRSADAAERDFRPWLTVDATLNSLIDYDPLNGGGIAFFIEIRARNVGKVAASNVAYLVRGIDLASATEPEKWFDALIEETMEISRFSTSPEWKLALDPGRIRDSLAPSEKHVSVHWCPVVNPNPRENCDRARKNYPLQICAAIIAAYSGIGPNANTFYTAKLLPVGYFDPPGFFDFIKRYELPVGVGDVTLGPARKAQTT